MSLHPLPAPKPSYGELELELARLREQLTVMESARWFDHFHALDGIRDDACPACGGRIVVEEYEQQHTEDGRRLPPGVRLRAVPWS